MHPQSQVSIHPYKNQAANLIYNLLFCDQLELFQEHSQMPYSYPLDILFSAKSSVSDLQNIIDDPHVDTRIKVFAFNRQRELGNVRDRKDLLGVIVELMLEEGLDVMASYQDGTARYINFSESMIIWETKDDTTANNMCNELFACSRDIVARIGAWDKPRRSFPEKGNSRITFLVSDGLYFGEGPTRVLFQDPMAGPALAKASDLMYYLTQATYTKK